ncbi:MAG: signal peptidase I [Flavobacteriales bacterium]
MFTIPYILLYLLILTLFICLGTVFEKAGKEKWKGYVPILNFFTWLQILKRPWWWLLLLIIPGVNLIMLIIMNVETAIVFGKRSTKEQWFFGALPWVAMAQLAFKDNSEYIGARDWNKKKKSQPREWGEAIVFAVVAATVIRTFFFEAFTIPTASMESSMNVGDYLFVSKMSYGAKSPMTPISIPLVHNRIPGSLNDSYVDWFKMPYFRMPGFGNVERMDAMVFNYPHGDTAIVDDFLMGHDYHSILTESAIFMAADSKESNMRDRTRANNARAQYLSNPEKYRSMARERMKKGFVPYSGMTGVNHKIGGLKVRPIDKREHYIKRCTGLPGNKLEIKNQVIHIDDVPLENAENTQFSSLLHLKKPLTRLEVAEIFGLHSWYQVKLRSQGIERKTNDRSKEFLITCSNNLVAEMRANSSVVDSVVNNIVPAGSGYGFLKMFPNSNLAPFNKWNIDNYGPVNIPAEGEVVNLTLDNVPLYKRIIEAYEGNTLEIKDGKIFINGSESESYTIKQNYYWLMGDNRHNSADSRFWGFVPEDHVVGKAAFTWMSRTNANDHFEPGFRWDRMFKTVK